MPHAKAAEAAKAGIGESASGLETVSNCDTGTCAESTIKTDKYALHVAEME